LDRYKMTSKVREELARELNGSEEIVLHLLKKTVAKTLCTAVINDGASTLTLKPKKVLGEAITIVYSGDANFKASTLAAPKLSKKGLL
jgi:recombinational DNA repair protein RecT